MNRTRKNTLIALSLLGSAALLSGCQGPASPTATEVIKHISASGLKAENPRDNTDGWCHSEGFDCEEWITTDNVTAVSFATNEQAIEFSKKWSSANISGNISIHLASGRGTSKDVKKYTKAVEELLASTNG